MDIRDLSFSQRALYELKQEQKKRYEQKKSKYHDFYWVKVKYWNLKGNDKEKWFQLPKDLQVATHQTSFQKNQDILLGSLINIPLSKYDTQGTTTITTGLIIGIKRRKQTTGNTQRITRSQFKKIHFLLGIFPTNRKECKRYLWHDYSQEDVARISKAVDYYSWYRLGVMIVAAFLSLACVLFIRWGTGAFYNVLMGTPK